MSKEASRPGKTTVTAGGLHKRTYYLPKDLLAKLREVAYEREVSKGQIVREALEQHFEHNDIARRIAGAFRRSLKGDPGFQQKVIAFLEELSGESSTAEELLEILMQEET